ncbi:hypothetical protein E2C01_082585 [Portunus trituberculatus]|uniref:Uncharacterized protein n=1 Tax=Portunus trituberculatus TaxID=210409 RepID=A0A5B7IZN7_PORTR|nr:hypothetical protein [Portunus trituberculatus]
MGMLRATSMLPVRPVLCGACPDDEMLHWMRNLALRRIVRAVVLLGCVVLREYDRGVPVT